MKIINAANNNNVATYYIDVYGDIFDTQEEAELLGMAGIVIVDGMYVGTLEQMKAAALEKYNA